MVLLRPRLTGKALVSAQGPAQGGAQPSARRETQGGAKEGASDEIAGHHDEWPHDFAGPTCCEELKQSLPLRDGFSEQEVLEMGRRCMTSLSHLESVRTDALGRLS